MKMNLEISPVVMEEKEILWRLLQLYLYDFSEFDAADPDNTGCYPYDYFERYWDEPGRFPFFMRVDGRLAGFALVRQFETPDYGKVTDLAEFFVMKKYRRQGVGRQAAFQIFDRFPGLWQVEQIEANTPAQVFWRKVIGEYSNGAYQETFQDDTGWFGPRQTFTSRHA
jgi:predicted acetyltransferase